MKSFIKVHYGPEEGIVYTEFPEIVEILQKHLSAEYLGRRIVEYNGTFTTYHLLKVSDLATAYTIIRNSLAFALGWD